MDPVYVGAMVILPVDMRLCCGREDRVVGGPLAKKLAKKLANSSLHSLELSSIFRIFGDSV